MHSSRMHTNHALTVSRGGRLVHPRRSFGGKKLKKKEKKIWRLPPKKLETPTPLKSWRPPKIWRTPRDQTPPFPLGADHPPVDRITDACKNITLAQLRCSQ